MMNLNDDIFQEVEELIDNHSFYDFTQRQDKEKDFSVNYGSYYTHNDGLLKRKPSRTSMLRVSKKQSLSFCDAPNDKLRVLIESKDKNNAAANVGTQMQRLEKNMVESTCKSRVRHEGRQRKVMIRMKEDKQNRIQLSTLEITSSQLRSIGQQQEELKDLLLTISRFYENQKEKNNQLQQQIESISNGIEHSDAQIKAKRKNIVNINNQIQLFKQQSEVEELRAFQALIYKANY